MRLKKYYFKVIRKWRNMNDIEFVFCVIGNNIIDASERALRRIKAISSKTAKLHNYGYDEEPFELLCSHGIVSMWDKRTDECIMAFGEVEIITEEEYNSSMCDKTFLNRE